MQLLLGTSRHDNLDVSAASDPYEVRGLAGNDTIFGSAFADLIVGGTGSDQMFGNAGDDIFLIEGTDSFADKVHGGDGFDTLLGGSGDDVFYLLTSIWSIERIDGGGGTDILRGAGWNYWDFSHTALVGIFEIDAGAGNDGITGSAGDDRIRGGAGDDKLDGGPGTDTAVYTANFAAYTLAVLSSGWLRVSTSANADGSDAIRNFEIVEFADGTYSPLAGLFTPFGHPTNALPLAAADGYQATEDESLVVNAASGVLANDQDPDGDALTVGAFDALSVQGGTVAMNLDGSFTYTPAPDFNGSDSFSYTVADGRGGSAMATVALTVTAVNDAPVASDDNYTARQDTALVVNAAAGVLANDRDPDGDVLTVGSFDASSLRGGSVVMNLDGSFSYIPPAGFTGNDSFSYTASDGSSQDVATVALLASISPPDMSTFESIIFNMPENEWMKLNVNEFQDVWTPWDQRPNLYVLGGSPRAVIQAWSAATWDVNRSEYLFWGGGHVIYEGNEVYKWSAETLAWERASLPSAVVKIANAHYETVDGWENSPISSHAFDNLEFLEIGDRMINFGGAAAHTGGPFVETDGITKTGPYLWDPSKADANTVGGVAGSHVQPDLFPDVVGGEMWDNRETWTSATEPRPSKMINSTTDYAVIDGVDVVFVNDFSQRLFKYTVPDVNDASQDRWELVGTTWDPYSGQGAGAYDADRNIYVRTSRTEFSYWDLNNAGPNNKNVGFMPVTASAEPVLSDLWGMEYDPVRQQFVLWRGDASVWYLQPPEQLGAAGWTLEKAPGPTLAAPSVPSDFRGILGKWDYIEEYDVFIGVNNHFTGDVWAYKPEEWTPDAWMS